MNFKILPTHLTQSFKNTVRKNRNNNIKLNNKIIHLLTIVLFVAKKYIPNKKD